MVTEPTLTLTPKVSAEYKPTDTLTLKGSVEVPVKLKVKNYSEWNLPEYNTKIEMFLAESGESEYVYIDYRYQE